MHATALVFAADPWYQDFSFWGVLLAALVSTGGATWLLARIHFRRRVERAREERERSASDLRTANAELKKLRAARGPEREELETRLTEARSDADRLRIALAQAQESGDRVQKTLDALNRTLRTVRQMEGLVWRAKPAADAPRFVPLEERRTPVVAVLNLKGGVGKTTLTANLGAAFARTGWRVLLVDLDLQASLTSLFLTGERLQQASQDQRLIQHFFEQTAAGARPQFSDFVHATTEPRVDLVGSADTLAYAELNLTIRWFLHPGGNDPRLFLRAALHGGGRFDLVLIDCPPLLNVSCVNALAAADYLLVPVMPSKSAADRVRPMITWLKALRKTLNPDLKMLGVVANRIRAATGMSDPETNLWKALRDQCHDAWGEPVPMCQTFIAQSTDVRDAENERRPLKAKDGTYDSFKKLAAELAGRLPQSSRPAAPAPTTKAKS